MALQTHIRVSGLTNAALKDNMTPTVAMTVLVMVADNTGGIGSNQGNNDYRMFECGCSESKAVLIRE